MRGENVLQEVAEVFGVGARDPLRFAAFRQLFSRKGRGSYRAAGISGAFPWTTSR